MIAILYPQFDFEAADIALKVQSLAKSKEPIYVVPKHYGRDESTVTSTLNKASMGLFIANEVNQLDEQTKHELQQLISNRRRVVFVIPHNYKVPKNVPPEDIVKYHRNDKTGVISDLTKWLNRVSSPHSSASKKKDNSSGILILAGLALLLLASKK